MSENYKGQLSMLVPLSSVTRKPVIQIFSVYLDFDHL